MANYALATNNGLSTTQYTSAVRNQIAKRTLTGLLSYSINFRDTNLINNPYKNRYYNFGVTTTMNGFDMIGGIADVYSIENRIITFLDDYGGLLNYVETKKFCPDYTDTKKLYSLLNHEIYSVLPNLGANSYQFSDSIDDGVQEIGKDTLHTGVKSMYNPRRNENFAANYSIYDEDGVPTVTNIDHISYSDTVTEFGDVEDYEDTSLLYKTNKLFKDGKIHSLINRFGTGMVGDAAEEKRDLLHTAFSIFGYSRGRNLLKKEPEIINSYENPYCRVWTSHYQYSKMTDLIRPFVNQEGSFESLYELQHKYGMLRPYYSNARLRDYSVMERGGIVRYTPDKELIFGNGYATENHGDIRNYMFSIENLAWKDAGDYYTSYLSKEQKGPFGGRIMWFPPYNLSFTESTSGNWSPVDVLGRIEPLYTFKGNSQRTGSIKFSILVDHPSTIDLFKEKKVNIMDDEVEQALLRFFAGCDDLNDYLPNDLTQEWMHYSAWTETTTKQVPGDDNDVDTDITEEIPDETPDEPKKEQDKITAKCIFLAFYPNNVSGYQDVNQKSDDASKKSGAATLFEQRWNVPRSAGYEMKKTARGSMGGISRYPMGRPGQTEYPYKTGGGKVPDVISYDYTGISGPQIRGDSLCDSVSEIWRQNSNTKFDRQDFGLNTKEMAAAVKAVLYSEDTSNIDSSLLDAATKIVERMGLEKGDNQTVFVYSLEDIKSLTLENLLKDIGGGNNIDETAVTSTIKISKTYGSASSHGEQVKNSAGGSMNADLGKRRAESLAYYLLNRGIISDDKISDVKQQINSSTYTPTQVDSSDGSDQSALSAKIGRNGMVEITFELAVKSDGTEGTVPVPEGTYQTGPDTLDTSAKYETVITEEKIKYFDWSENVDTVSFDNEFLYFDRLKNEQDNIIYKKIKDKFKFFDPAFHAITPEGFNARLTFLQQCVRTGPTKGASDFSSDTIINSSDGSTTSTSTYGAGNLAFGRPPVCILRIGDFFFSKVLITTLSISYKTLDLNPEGIGVQPMYADIDLGVTFIGGQDITGPISQLQNAVSSNFYANTSIYDKSSKTNDIGIYQKGGLKFS